ncbi:hypothetical protein GYA93_04135 [Gordonia desulfuricans]|uniref:Uncharacterized protein n=1 Tax=Gordonia desulfuricans TaxID=89051 RepID=A0A7K3LKI5_9ACTN|nr:MULTISPECIES: hypothetical protein [Gordonia]NDK88772.1 hypothetical protein [Gordonia desulfuricans]WLP89448.1 hypothetical protein Q9K23_17950 [Gordonia sp. NB41Y]
MTTSHEVHPMPRWLKIVMYCDRTASSWYIGTGVLFAPILLIVDPWPAARVVALVVIAGVGLWLGLLGVAMATGLSILLRRGGQLPETFWKEIVRPS